MFTVFGYTSECVGKGERKKKRLMRRATSGNGNIISLGKQFSLLLTWINQLSHGLLSKDRHGKELVSWCNFGYFDRITNKPFLLYEL